MLFWRVQGASKSVPFASSALSNGRLNAKVIIERDTKVEPTDNEWPDTLYLNNRDLLPVKFRSANETEIVVDSFFENHVLPGTELRAVEFGVRGHVDKVDFTSSGWETSSKAKLRRGKFKLKKRDAIGHFD